MDWARILAYVTGTVDQDPLARNEYLAAENRIMKAQLNGRMKLSDAERGALGSQPPAAPRTAKRREFAGRSFPSAITSRDNSLRAQSGPMKSPAGAGMPRPALSLKAMYRDRAFSQCNEEGGHGKARRQDRGGDGWCIRDR